VNPPPQPTCPHFDWLAIGLCGLMLLVVPAIACAQPAAAETPPVQQVEPGQQIEPGPAKPPLAPTADGPPATPTAAVPATAPVDDAYSRLNVWELLEAGGTIGWLIVALSIAFLALLLEHILAVRHGTLCPRGLGAEVHRQIEQGHFPAALAACEKRPSFLAAVVAAGLAEVELGYSAVEKAMEDAAQQQAARLYRKLEYFTMIGTITPMLGLLGTVWGMILAFMEFEVKANPSPSELAPGIYKALVTTLQGLCVAIPALAAYALLRNRTDELVAEASLAAEHAFSGFKRALHRRKVDPAEPRRVRRSEAAPDSTGAVE
jgi:biopolymer transport protein ExbB